MTINNSQQRLLGYYNIVTPTINITAVI